MEKTKKTASGKKRQKPFIDRIILAAAVVEPLFVVPQVVQIFRTQNASGVSIATWVGLNIMTALWVYYAYVHRDRALFIYQALFFTFNFMVIIGAMIFNGTWV